MTCVVRFALLTNISVDAAVIHYRVEAPLELASHTAALGFSLGGCPDLPGGGGGLWRVPPRVEGEANGPALPSSRAGPPAGRGAVFRTRQRPY